MNYLILRRKNGSIRLLLPTENSRVMRSALRMYYPSRPLGYLYKFFNYLFLPLLSKFNLIEKVECISGLCPHLDNVLESFALFEAKFVGVLVSDVGSRSKSTLKIMNSAGEELAYARIALLPDARQVIEHETKILKALSMRKVSDGFPQVLSSGCFENPKMSYSVQSVGPNKSFGSSLSFSHLSFLDSLVANATSNLQDVLNALKQNLNSVIVDRRISCITDRVFQNLSSAESFLIEEAVEHGDFVPWNIRKNQNGGIFVFDWEHADLCGLAWMDVLHFVYQIESLVNRKKALDIYASLMQVFDVEYNTKSLNKLSEPQKKTIIVIYLLKSMLIGHKEGMVSLDDYQAKISVMNIAISGVFAWLNNNIYRDLT